MEYYNLIFADKQSSFFIIIIMHKYKHTIKGNQKVKIIELEVPEGCSAGGIWKIDEF